MNTVVEPGIAFASKVWECDYFSVSRSSRDGVCALGIDGDTFEDESTRPNVYPSEVMFAMRDYQMCFRVMRYINALQANSSPRSIAI
jgi:hypothetical protein